MEFPTDPKPTEEEMINAYVKTLAAVVGSEEEAKKKIYSVSTVTYTGFGALISEELSHKVKGLPGVLWVLPDSYLDVPNKDYGGDLFVDGKVIHRPIYWYNQRQQSRNRPRPRYDRRRETMQVERREPRQRPPSMQAQESAQGGGTDLSLNQGRLTRINEMRVFWTVFKKFCILFDNSSHELYYALTLLTDKVEKGPRPFKVYSRRAKGQGKGSGISLEAAHAELVDGKNKREKDTWLEVVITEELVPEFKGGSREMGIAWLLRKRRAGFVSSAWDSYPGGWMPVIYRLFIFF
ncbi:hypothetical protein GH714_018223 [Hevea brasiliensis]|uniref:MORF/ORRM1/DAG-like MORF domain-containing protein n=1 Tax=Hevea brasiliensis TaxID=3981 RepID=A0A6A6MNQ9_HEVBR|nr:hypothetical protein GH714_018223 [Hevea brasiliensis]